MNNDRQEIRELLADVSAQTGLDFSDRHVDQLRQTVQRAAHAAECESVSAFRQLMHSSPGAFDDFVGELTVGETFFFRDERQFAVIRDLILPEIRQRRGHDGVLRLWSAGCASGEEAYSLAILLEEAALSPGASGYPSHVLATDISRPALSSARAARYRNWSLRGDSTSLPRKYLTESDGLFVLDDRIWRRVAFEYLNLAADVYPSLATDTWGMDLILCRNVLIYFDRETIARVYRRLWECLVPGGWLVVGASDPQPTEFAEFTTVLTPAGIVCRRPHATEESGAHAGSLASHDWQAALNALHTPLGSDASAVTATPESTVANQSLPPPLTSQVAPPVTPEPSECEVASLNRIRELANRDVAAAEILCSELVVQQRLSEGLHYMHAVLLMHLGRHEESLEQLRRLIFLNRSLPIAHFTQGTVLRRLKRNLEARRSFRNALQACQQRRPEEHLPLGDGETAQRLIQAIQRQLELLDSIVPESQAIPPS